MLFDSSLFPALLVDYHSTGALPTSNVMTNEDPNDWKSVSLALLKDPHDFLLWQLFVYCAEYQNEALLDSTSTKAQQDLLRHSYDALLRKYPCLSKYWIAYAQWEWKFGSASRADTVFRRGLRTLALDVHYWLAYLTFRVETISEDVMEVAEVFEAARENIGFHYYAYEFYSLYSSFLKTYATAENKFEDKLALLLRLIMEIPLYDYAALFRYILSFIEQKNTSFKHLTHFVGESTLKSIRKECQNNSSLIHKKIHKYVCDAYIVAQYKSYELFKFEKAIPSSVSFTLDKVPVIARETWEQYLVFSEFNYPYQYVVQLYERCIYLKGTADAVERYTDYLVSRQKYALARSVLQKGIALYPVQKSSILLCRLVDLEICMGRVVRARDLIASFLMCNKSSPVHVYDKLLEVEALVSRNDEEHICSLVKEIISVTKSNSYFRKIRNFALSKERRGDFYLQYVADGTAREMDLENCEAFWKGLRENADESKIASVKFPEAFAAK